MSTSARDTQGVPVVVESADEGEEEAPPVVFVPSVAVTSLHKQDKAGRYREVKHLVVNVTKSECLQSLVSFQRVGDNEELLQVKSIKALPDGKMGAIQSQGVMLDDYLLRINGINIEGVSNQKVKDICKESETVEMLFVRDEGSTEKHRLQVEILHDPLLDNSRAREKAAATLLLKQLKHAATAPPQTHAPAPSGPPAVPTPAPVKPKIQHVAYPPGPIVVTHTDHPLVASSAATPATDGGAAGGSSGGKRAASPTKPTKVTPKVHDLSGGHDEQQTKKRAHDDVGGGVGQGNRSSVKAAKVGEKNVSQPMTKKPRKATASSSSSSSSAAAEESDEEVSLVMTAPHQKVEEKTSFLNTLLIGADGEMVRAKQTFYAKEAHPCKVLELSGTNDGTEAFVGWESNNFKGGKLGQWLPFTTEFFEPYSLMGPRHRR